MYGRYKQLLTAAKALQQTVVGKAKKALPPGWREEKDAQTGAVLCQFGGKKSGFEPVFMELARDGSIDPETCGPGRSVSLTAYIDMVEALGGRIANDPRPCRST